MQMKVVSLTFIRDVVQALFTLRVHQRGCGLPAAFEAGLGVAGRSTSGSPAALILHLGRGSPGSVIH